MLFKELKSRKFHKKSTSTNPTTVARLNTYMSVLSPVLSPWISYLPVLYSSAHYHRVVISLYVRAFVEYTAHVATPLTSIHEHNHWTIIESVHQLLAASDFSVRFNGVGFGWALCFTGARIWIVDWIDVRIVLVCRYSGYFQVGKYDPDIFLRHAVGAAIDYLLLS